MGYKERIEARIRANDVRIDNLRMAAESNRTQLHEIEYQNAYLKQMLVEEAENEVE